MYFALLDVKCNPIPLFRSRKLNMSIIELANKIIKQRTHVHKDIRKGTHEVG